MNEPWHICYVCYSAVGRIFFCKCSVANASQVCVYVGVCVCVRTVCICSLVGR